MTTTIDFPVHVPQELLDKNPKFNDLLKALSRFVDTNGVSVSHKEMQEKAAADLENARQQFQLLKLIYSTVQDIILELEIEVEISRSSNGTQTMLLTSSDRSEDIQAFRTVLSRVEAQQYLGAPQQSNYNAQLAVSPDGSTPSENADKLLGMDPYLFAVDCHEVGVALQTILPELLNALQAKLDVTMQAAAFTPKDQSTRYTAFVQTMIKRRAELESETANLAKDHETATKYFWSAMRLVGQTLMVLQQIMSDFKLRQQLQNDQITIKWLQAKSATMLRKLSVLQHQVLRDTYTPESVKALTQIRQHLVSRMQATEESYKKSTKLLEEYQTVGPAFMQLVGQYSKLLDQISDIRFALDQLHQK